MKLILKLVIHFYRWAVKPFYKRSCLFRVSCSQEVLNELEQGGYIAGITALKARFNYCRPGYIWSTNPDNGKIRLVFKDGKYLEESEISSELLRNKE